MALFFPIKVLHEISGKNIPPKPFLLALSSYPTFKKKDMAVTRSYNNAVAATQRLGQEVARMITQLGEYVKGLVTSRDPDWMGRIKEWIRWILEKMRELYQRMRYAITHPNETVTATKAEILGAVDTAKHQATDLMYGARAGINEALEAVRAKILELRMKEEETEAVKMETDENDADNESSDDEGPAAKKIKLE